MSHISAAMLPALLGRPVAYQPVFTRLPGVGVQAAIFLSQALFLTNTPTAQRRDGWFWKEQQGAQDSWESETGMSAKTQVTARRQLRNVGVLEEVRKGVPAKTWYRVNSEALAHQLSLALGQVEEENPAPAPATAHNLPSGESGNAQAENQESRNGSAQNPPNGVFLQRLQQRITPSLSDAGEPESSAGADVFEQAARSADDGTPPPRTERRFAMTLDWQPDANQLAAACFRVGLPTDTTPAPHQLAKFTAHHADFPERRHGAGNWHTKLADWLRNDQRAAAPHANGGNHADRSNTGAPGAGLSDRDAVRQQLADPHDTSWADGLWGDDDWTEPGTQASDHGAGESDFYPAGGDFPADVLECVPDEGNAQTQPAGAGAGAGAVADAAGAGNAGTGDKRAQARGQHLAADNPGVGFDAGTHGGGCGHA